MCISTQRTLWQWWIILIDWSLTLLCDNSLLNIVIILLCEGINRLGFKYLGSVSRKRCVHLYSRESLI